MIGKLNQRGLIEAKVQTPDGGGGFSESWETAATVWLSLEPVSGADTFGPDATESRVHHKITLRRIAGVAAGNRVTVGARHFAVHDVLDSGLPDPLMTLLCEELP
jgi:SPP1 family predicted phage head-tail adaptor